MGMSTLQLPESFSIGKYTFGFDDDFEWYVTAHRWTTTATDSGSITVASAAGGILTISPSDGSVADNDETYLLTTNSPFLIAANKPIEGECTLQFSEAATNKANIFFGFKDSIAANTLVDDGGGMATSFSGACIYKVDGGTVWKCIASLGSTQTIITSTTTAGGTAYQRLRVEIRPVNSTIAEASFFCDSGSGMVPLYDAAQTARNVPIKISFTYTSAAQMMCGAGIKNGSTTLETLSIDRIAAFQAR